MNFAVAVAGPYYAMYMLKDLAFTYVEFTIVVAAAVVAQFIVMRSWGVVSDQFGNRKILSVCGWLVAINPFFWLVSSNLWWIIFAQLYSGFFWSGFNLAAANFVFDAVTPPKRARCIAYQSIVNGVLVFIGALAGGCLLTYYPDWLTRRFGLWTPESAFLVLFLLSGVCRVAVVCFLLPSFKEVRQVLPIRGHELLIRVSSLRPLSGASFALLSDDDPDESKSVDGKKPLS
jgi:MFS family permease